MLRQTRAAAARYGVKVAAKTRVCQADQDAYGQKYQPTAAAKDDAELWRGHALLPPMASFTFLLRLSKELFEDDNFRSFVRFVARMANETGTEVVEVADVVQAEEVRRLLRAARSCAPGGSRYSRRTSSGFVAAQLFASVIGG